MTFLGLIIFGCSLMQPLSTRGYISTALSVECYGLRDVCQICHSCRLATTSSLAGIRLGKLCGPRGRSV